MSNIGFIECCNDCSMHRGHSFLSANEELLARYAACPTSAEVIAVQAAYLAELQAPPRPSPGAPGIRGLGLEETSPMGRMLVTQKLFYFCANPSAPSMGARRPHVRLCSRSEHSCACMLSEHMMPESWRRARG